MNGVGVRCGGRSRFLALALAVSLLLVGSLVAIPRAEAQVGLTVSPLFPGSLTIGSRGVSAAISVANLSAAEEGTVTIPSGGLRLTPSCGGYVPECVDPVLEQGVIAVSDTATGRSGTACEGLTF